MIVLNAKQLERFTDGTRIACGNTIESLLEADFKLVINDVSYDVSPPNQEIFSAVRIQKKINENIFSNNHSLFFLQAFDTFLHFLHIKNKSIFFVSL